MGAGAAGGVLPMVTLLWGGFLGAQGCPQLPTKSPLWAAGCLCSTQSLSRLQPGPLCANWAVGDAPFFSGCLREATAVVQRAQPVATGACGALGCLALHTASLLLAGGLTPFANRWLCANGPRSPKFKLGWARGRVGLEGVEGWPREEEMGGQVQSLLGGQGAGHRSDGRAEVSYQGPPGQSVCPPLTSGCSWNPGGATGGAPCWCPWV